MDAPAPRCIGNYDFVSPLLFREAETGEAVSYSFLSSRFAISKWETLEDQRQIHPTPDEVKNQDFGETIWLSNSRSDGTTTHPGGHQYMTVYLIRHGQSEFNVGSPHAVDPMIFDAPLTDLGKSQADQAGKQMAEAGVQQVICSPLTRAIQTAIRIFGENAPITVDATHREWLTCSCDAGRPPQDLARDFPMLRFDHLDDHWWHKGPVNENNVPIEPEDVYHDRVRTFDTALQAKSERPIAVVGHGYFFRELSGRMLKNCEIHRYEPGELFLE
jgi:glucosyl-3-phosphoglycerate phosphatase